MSFVLLDIQDVLGSSDREIINPFALKKFFF